MRLATARTPAGTRAVVQDLEATRLLELPTVSAALTAGVLTNAPRLRGTPVSDLNALDFAPAVTGPVKIVCIGHNFRTHILEMGHGLPQHPNVFSKFPEALVGARDDIQLDGAAATWDWEAELAVIIGTPVRRATREAAGRAIAGYTVANDVSARDWQRRASQWLVGKTFEATTPLGPWIVTADEADPSCGLAITCSVDGIEKQRSSTSDLLFDPAELVAYVSQVVTLQPGDVILTGTPGGVGAARKPEEWLTHGSRLVTAIEGIGECRNRCVSTQSLTAHNA